MGAQMGVRHYYAVYRPLGVTSQSVSDTLYRYGSSRQRNEDMVRVNRSYPRHDPHMVSITAEQARHLFPKALREGAIEWDGWEQGDRNVDGPFWRVTPDGDEWTGRPRYR